MPLAEEGWVEGELPELAARTYLEPLAGAGIDTLILGCTHYPLLKETIGRAMTALGDPGVTLVDSAEAVAARAAASVASSGGRFDDPPRRRFCVTDAGGAFLDVARRILDDPRLTLETVELDAHEAGAHRVD